MCACVHSCVGTNYHLNEFRIKTFIAEKDNASPQAAARGERR